MDLIPTEEIPGPNISKKIHQGLIEHVYTHVSFSLLASIFCATIILYDIYSTNNYYFTLPWYVLVIGVTVARYVLVKIYFRRKALENNLAVWNNLFIIGAALSGFSWGIVGYFLFPLTSMLQQTLIILIIAGVTAGAAPALSAVRVASISFLLLALVPLIFQILKINTRDYLLLSSTITVYLIYLITFSLRSHYMIKNIISLRYENISLLKKLKFLSTHDPLTNLNNSRLFYDNLSIALKRATETESCVALLYIDLDKFKNVNDQFGHHIGDKLLKNVALKIKNELRPSDFFARLGGDEFVVMVEHVTYHESIIDLAKRICQALAKPVIIDENNINISASIGVSIYPVDTSDMTTLIKIADNAMYYVKKNGTNNFHFNNGFST